MASGFHGGGDIRGGRSAAVGGCPPIQVTYRPQRPDVGVAGGSGGMLPKRPLAEFQRQQLQQDVFARSVRQKALLQQQGFPPMAPFSPVDFSSSFSSSSYSFSSASSPAYHPQNQRPAFSPATVSTAPGDYVPPRNGSYLFLQQQLLRQQQQRQQGHNLPHAATNLPFPRSLPAAADPPPLPERKTENATATMKNRLQELEKQLLDDNSDDEEPVSISGSVVTTSEWSETMQNLISPSSCSSASSPKTQSPSPSSTCSSSSSCCPPTAPSRQLLLDAASAIVDGNVDAAAAILDRLKRASATNPRGDPEQRLTAYMVGALQARINALSSPEGPLSLPSAEMYGGNHLLATQKLYESSPCFYLSFVAANLAILDATRGRPKIHIVDFDVGQGLQYAALVNALAERPASSGRPTVRVTAVSDPTFPFTPANKSSSSCLKMVGERLEKQAERAGVGLRFSFIRLRASDLDATALGCEADEALAVNFAFLLHRLPDESVTPENPRDQLLRLARALSPAVVTLVEKEANCNTAPFAARFAEASAYCAALFESLEATAPRESADRARVEECLGRSAANAVAREGRDRVERCEVFGKWRARMGMAGYRPSPIGPAVVDAVKARLAGGNPGFSLKEDAGAVCLGWADRVLTVTSAWR